MTYLLFPGRHLLNTTFQDQQLRQILQLPINLLSFWEGKMPAFTEPLDQIIFAVTSANHQHTRYNPIPFHVRTIGLDRFARTHEMAFGIRYRILGIPHYLPTPRFAEFTLKEISEQSEGELQLTPQNCVLLCSTPAVIAMYQRLGFAILPAELGVSPSPPTPIELIKKLVAMGEYWQTDRTLRTELSAATYDLWQDFPDIPQRILRLWRDPLLTDSGDLTQSRDYAAYAYGMSNNGIIALKYQDVKPAILAGKIVDEGCGDGSLLALIAQDFPDSDLIGIEITGEFMARCLERQRAGEYAGTFTHFHQRNITHKIFTDNSIHTTLCNATVHELWSYGDGAATVQAYFAQKYAQTAKGGRLIIRDVVAPDHKDQQLYLWLNHQNGQNNQIFTEFTHPNDLEKHLATLSTYARFLRFARDFLAQSPHHKTAAIQFQEQLLNGQHYVILSLGDAAEFISKMDYLDNWQSEMYEQFAFWDFAEWKQALIQAGFQVLENPNHPQQGSRTYLNNWLVENRYKGKVALFTRQADGQLIPFPFPPSNIILVAEKR